MSAHVRTEMLYLQIAESIAMPIRAGMIVRGERIPSVHELARRHGVSLGTVTQAYRMLEDSRLIEARPRSGYFVAARPRSLPEAETSNPPQNAMAVDVSSLAARVMHLAHDPAYVSFGAACPSADLVAEDRVRRAISRAAQRHRATLTKYTIGSGDESLRRATARHALRMGCQLDARDIVVTNSCLESITLCLRAVTQPGDVVALESPTLFSFLEILENLHLRALEIPTHPRTGLSLDALQLAFDTQPVKAVLAVPTQSNPLGASMPLADRRRLAQRLATMRAVASHPHATADELTDAVWSVIGAISRQAVYETLAALVEKDLVRRIQPPGSAARYEDRVRDNHHHLICRACGVVIDVDCSVGAAPCRTASDGHGFSIDEAEVIYWGYCPSCQKLAAASNAGKLAAPAGTAETARRRGPARAPRT